MSAFISMRRILDITENDDNLLSQIENIMYPCLLHSLSEEDRMIEGIYCINFIAFHGYRNKPFTSTMWKLFTSLIYICTGNDKDCEIGLGMEYMAPISICLKTFISRDPKGIL